jgi:thioredoxin 1
MGPALDKLAGTGLVQVVKVDVDDNQDIAAEAGVAAMPTFNLYRNKAVVKTAMGYMDEGKFNDWVQKSIA